MKTRLPLPSVIIALLIAISLPGYLRATPTPVSGTVLALNLHAFNSHGMPTALLADAYSPGVQGMFDDSSQREPFESLRQPWYVRMWPDSRILRIMMIVGVIVGIKALLSRGSGGKINTQSHQPTPRPQQPPVRPLNAPPPPASRHPATGWFYHSNGNDIGPFDEAALRQMKNAGVINFATPIRRAEGGNWITFSDVFGSN